MEAEFPPSWINAEFLESVLRMEIQDDQVTVIKYDVTPAIPKGGGYLSILHRVVVEYTTNNADSAKLSLIVKSQPVDYYQLQFSNKVNAFNKEVNMYQNVLPAMNHLAKVRRLEKPLKFFAPKYFWCPKRDTLVLEDLEESGFSLADRRKRLDFDQSLLVLKSLANFHAASIALYIEDPSYVESFGEGHYNESTYNFVKAFIDQTFEALISNVEKWEGFERFVSKLDKLTEKAPNIMIEQIKPKKGEISVLNHGDAWVNNLMFKYSQNNRKPQDVRFVDFQLSRFTSPAIELQFFFYLSVHEDIIFQRLDELVKEYHSALKSCLEDYGCDPNLIPLNKLKQELKRTEEFAVITACCKLWFVLVNPEDVDHIVLPNDFIRGKGTFNSLTKVYADLLIREVFQKFLLYFERKGLL